MPNLIIAKAKRLAVYQQKVAELEKEVDQARAKVLAKLHEKYGFADANALIKAIRAAAAGRRDGPQGRRAGGHKKHARITADLKEKIKVALKAGQTAGTVAVRFGVSVPSVYNVKKAFGLVKARKVPLTKKRTKVKKAAKASKPAVAEKPAEAKQPSA